MMQYDRLDSLYRKKEKKQRKEGRKKFIFVVVETEKSKPSMQGFDRNV